MNIETENLLIISCTPEILTAAIQGDQELAEILGTDVAEGWTEFGTAPLQYSFERLSEDDEARGWWTWFPIHKQDNVLIGSGGYKGKPDENGIVEIGYEIAPAYRNKGLAKELAKALIDNALKHDSVATITAHTLAHENASVSILLKLGFVKVDEILDPEDGLIWSWMYK